MRKFLAGALRGAVVGALFLLSACYGHAQAVPVAGQTRFSNEWVASNFGRWQLRVSQGSTGTGAYSITFPAGGAVTASGNQSFTPFNTTTRITVGVGTIQETVTPSAVSGCGVGATGNCVVTATFTYAHGAGTLVFSGSGGFDEAINVAHSNGGGLVLVDNSTGITDALIVASTAIFNNVQVHSFAGNSSPTVYQVTPTVLTAVATPAVRVAAASCPTPIIANTVCDSPTGAVGTWTNTAYYVCVYYLDQMGQRSPCSATANYTSAGSLAIYASSPAASTGAVGWGIAIGVSYAAAYELPITSSNCVLSTAEITTPACAMGAAGSFPTPSTTTALHPGYVVNTYNPNDVTHTVWGYQARHELPMCGGLVQDFTPFLATGGGTTTQIQVIGSVAMPNSCLNTIGKTLRVTGKITMTNGTSETPSYRIALGPTFSTGTPTNICVMSDTTALSAAVYSAVISCTITTNATGTSGTLMPDGWSLTQLGAGTTTGAVGVDTGTAAITNSIAGVAGTPMTLYVVYVGTSGTSTAVQLLDLHLEMP